ncbi:MAG: hypothetical protein ACREGJ_00750 [Candidatus Saccharimonadales bacterium]
MKAEQAHEYLFGGERQRKELFNKLIAAAFHLCEDFAKGKEDNFEITHSHESENGVEAATAFRAKRLFALNKEFLGYIFELELSKEEIACKLPPAMVSELVADGNAIMYELEDGTTNRSEYTQFSIANPKGFISCEIIEKSIYFVDNEMVGMIKNERLLDSLSAAQDPQLEAFYELIASDPALRQLDELTSRQTARRLGKILRTLGVKA